MTLARIRYLDAATTPAVRQPAKTSAPTKAKKKTEKVDDDVEPVCADLVLVVANDPERVVELASWAAQAAPTSEVLILSDGKRAIAALKRRPRLIVADFFLSGASSLELLRAARDHAVARHGKFLLLADGDAARTPGFEPDAVLGRNVAKAAFMRAVRALI